MQFCNGIFGMAFDFFSDSVFYLLKVELFLSLNVDKTSSSMVFSVLGIRRSNREPYSTNVEAEASQRRYFWAYIHKQAVKCENVHYLVQLS